MWAEVEQCPARDPPRSREELARTRTTADEADLRRLRLGLRDAAQEVAALER